MSAMAPSRIIIPVVGGALLWTLEKGSAKPGTPETAAAWTAAYSALSGYMISEAYAPSSRPSEDTPCAKGVVIGGSVSGQGRSCL